MPVGRGNAILILGLGNRLLSDDAAGPLALDRLAEADWSGCGAPVTLRDGGTMGMNLLIDIEDAAALIAIDAASFGAEPGTVSVVEGVAMDAMLRGNKKTAHEVALADLMGAAALAGSQPRRRALVAVQPESTQIGLQPTPAVLAALPMVAAEAERLARRWAAEMQMEEMEAAS